MASTLQCQEAFRNNNFYYRIALTIKEDQLVTDVYNHAR